MTSSSTILLVPQLSTGKMSKAVPYLDATTAINAQPRKAGLPGAEEKWLKHMGRVCSGEEATQDSMSCAAYHASHQHLCVEEVKTCVSIFLSFVYGEAASVPMIHHSMDVIKIAVNILNPIQVPVFTLDQPLYALAKHIMWTWPDTQGENNVVIMLEGMPIEMATLSRIGALYT